MTSLNVSLQILDEAFFHQLDETKHAQYGTKTFKDLSDEYVCVNFIK